MTATQEPLSNDRSMVQMNVLVVEDDPILGRALLKGLTEAGHNCVWVKDGKSGLEHSLSQRFDAIVLDLLLPVMPGLVVLRKIRVADMRTPIVILTGLSRVEDRVLGLKAGADDYLTKPFAFIELMARLEAVCRRTVDRPSAVMTICDIRLDLTTQRVQKGDTEIDLTRTEIGLLALLMRHAGHVVTRNMICEHLWDTVWDGVANAIEVHINRIRKKFEDKGASLTVETVRGRGYVLRTDQGSPGSFAFNKRH
jgi:two-component system OmpR family response regulator